MVIGKEFAWAHLPKTGGDATLVLFKLFPEAILFADYEESNVKHTPFVDREARVTGKSLAMNIRRLPFWMLSRWQHVSRHGLHPDYEPIPIPSAEEMAESDLPDSRIELFTDGGRFKIEHWIRTEHLVDDFLEFISGYAEVTPDRRQAAASLRPVNAYDYDHDVASWFTPGQIARMYERNPAWAELERHLYGERFEVDRVESPGLDLA
jgi:hypothetical protein